MFYQKERTCRFELQEEAQEFLVGFSLQNNRFAIEIRMEEVRDAGFKANWCPPSIDDCPHSVEIGKKDPGTSRTIRMFGTRFLTTIRQRARLNGDHIGEPRICSKTADPIENWVISRDMRMLGSMSRMMILRVTFNVRHVRPSTMSQT